MLLYVFGWMIYICFMYSCVIMFMKFAKTVLLHWWVFPLTILGIVALNVLALALLLG